MTNPTDLATYLDRQLSGWCRACDRNRAWRRAPIEFYLPGEIRPSPEQLAEALLADAEFRSLELASWLTTPDGEFLTAAVESVSPPFLRADEELIVDALKLAVTLQRDGKQALAGKIAVTAVAAALLCLSRRA